MAKKTFRAELLAGHKSAAVLVPFDPELEWGSEPVAAPIPGRVGHPVRGKVVGVPFEGFIGKRWGNFFLLVDAELQKAAGSAVGDMLLVELAPAKANAKRAKKP